MKVQSVSEADLRAVPHHQAARKDARDLHEPATQAAAGLGAWHASQASTFHARSGSRSALTYIYGIGQSTAAEVCADARALAGHEGARPHRRGDHEAPQLHRREPRGRGRPPPRAVAGHQAPEGDRLLPGIRHRRGLPVNGPAHEDERPHAARARRRPSGAARRRSRKDSIGSTTPPGNQDSQPPSRQEEHRDRPGAHQDVLQQHDRDADRQGRGT